MKHIYLVLLIILSSCSDKYKVERTIEGDQELKKTQLLIKKIYERCENYIMSHQKMELADSQKKWINDNDELCRGSENTKDCLSKNMGERLEALESNCALKKESELATQTPPMGIYSYRALCGESPCGGVEGKMQIWEINPEVIYIRASTKVKGASCKCELSGQKTKEGYFIKYHQPSSKCDGTMVPFNKTSYAMDIDSCGYCCSTKGGLRGEWRLSK